MLKIDLHTHTIASGHAYSTIFESAKYASEAGLEVLAITDHGPSMVGASHVGYFGNMNRIPRDMCGIHILMGCEANVIDTDGTLDVSEGIIDGLDIILVGLHKLTPYPSNLSVVDNTNALIKAISKNKVDIISHPYRLDFPVDIVELAKAARDYGTLLELNLSLLKIFGEEKQILSQINLMLEVSEKFGVKISISSDAHIMTEIGDDSVLKDLQIMIPQGLKIGDLNGYDEVKAFLRRK